jgi:hypothetical protein
MTGPLVVVQVVFGPVKFQVGAPTGACDPATPEIVAEYVMTCPEALVDCTPTTESAGTAFGTAITIVFELAI